MSYPGHSLGVEGSSPSAEVQSVYSATLAKRVAVLKKISDQCFKF